MYKICSFLHNKGSEWGFLAGRICLIIAENIGEYGMPTSSMRMETETAIVAFNNYLRLHTHESPLCLLQFMPQ